MPSPEGEGRAKAALERAWDGYYGANKAVNARLFAAFPELRDLLKGRASSSLVDLIGFWVMWRLCGGFEGVQKATGMGRTSLYRRISMFRQVFGEHPDVYEFPGITVDPAEFVRVMAERNKSQ